MTAPPLSRSTELGRGYTHPVTGELVPSVTTTLKAVAKPNLNDWIARVTADYVNEHWDELASMAPDERRDKIKGAHEEVSRPKADLGTRVHEIAEAWMKGVPTEPDKATDPYVKQFTLFLMDFRPAFLETEFTVWSHSAGYAGTADALMEINGAVWIIDYKAGRGVYEEFGLQLAALRNADVLLRPDGTESPMYRCDYAGVLHLRPRSYKLIPVYEDEGCFSAFLGALEVFRWFSETSPHVLGEPL